MWSRPIRATARDDTGIDISASIRAINALKAELPAANVEGAQQRLSSPDAGFSPSSATTPATTPRRRHAVLVLYNPTGRRSRSRPGR